MINVDKVKEKQYDQDFYCHPACFKKHLNSNDKQLLYWLIYQYLSKYIDARTFCNEYHYCYDFELDHDSLNPQELKVFRDLSLVANMFSEHEEDLKQYPEIFFSEKELKQKAMDSQLLLDRENFGKVIATNNTELKYTCCFCKKTIESTNINPCAVNVLINFDKEKEEQYSQDFFCHLECFKKHLTSRVPLYLEYLGDE